MDEMQTGELLARIQIHDNRRVDDLVIEEWHHDLAEIRYDDALEVVRAHRAQENAPYLTAGIVLAGVRKLRSKRLAGIDEHLYLIDEQFPSTPEGVRDALAARRAAIARIANGEAHDAVFGAPAPVEARRVPDLGRAFRRVSDVPALPDETREPPGP